MDYEITPAHTMQACVPDLLGDYGIERFSRTCATFRHKEEGEYIFNLGCHQDDICRLSVWENTAEEFRQYRGEPRNPDRFPELFKLFKQAWDMGADNLVLFC